MYKFGLDPTRVRPAVRASEEPIIRFFSYHDAHPIALGMVVLERFGPEAVEWEAEALKTEIIKSFKATSISDHNWQKLQAFRAILLATSPWSEWEVFENVMQAFNNNIPNPEIVQRCTVAQLMAGVDIMNEIREEEFHPEVERYISACAIEDGITCLPGPLAFAQETLSEPQYRCRDCGNEDDDDLEDGRCDVCVERYADERNLNRKPAPHVPDGIGRNIERFLKRDPAGVKELFERWKGSEQEDVDHEDPVQVQAAKLVVAHKYMLQRRGELVEQLKELKSWVTQ